MQKFIFVFCLSFIFSTMGLAQGLSQQGSKFAAFKAAGALVPHSFPTTRMKKGRVDLKFVPALLSFEHEEQGAGGRQFQDMDGIGYALGTTYGLSDEWGLGLMALGFSMDGTGTTMNSSTGQFGSDEAKGHVVTLSGIYDPFIGGDEDFHMPLMLGLSYLNLEETSSITSGSSSITSNRELSDLGFSLGIMAQWTLGKWFRLSPFAFMAQPMSDVTDTCTATGPSASCPTTLTSVSKGTEGAGLDINIRPWNFSFQYLAPVSGMSSIAVKWETSFGEK